MSARKKLAEERSETTLGFVTLRDLHTGGTCEVTIEREATAERDLREALADLPAPGSSDGGSK